MPRGIKRLGYKAAGDVSQPGQAAHWEGFTFQGGPVKVEYRGPWGCIRVWGASKGEGVRVIRHACAAAGIDPADPQGLWSAWRTEHPRFQRVATYRVAMRHGLPVVTVRDGPGGSPLIGL